MNVLCRIYSAESRMNIPSFSSVVHMVTSCLVSITHHNDACFSTYTSSHVLAAYRVRHRTFINLLILYLFPTAPFASFLLRTWKRALEENLVVKATSCRYVRSCFSQSLVTYPPTSE
jgi:hypothetical protein